MRRYRALEPDAPALLLDGSSLRIEDVVEVARLRRRVRLDPVARHRVACGRAMVDVLLEGHDKVYGLTTGFGKLRDVAIAPEDVACLQVNLIRSHAAGVGDPFPEDVVRAAMLLRANTLCLGNSGVRPETVEQLVAMLNDDVYPYVPQQGSVGASGDLAPLAHLVLVLIGDPGGLYYPRARRECPDEVVRRPDPRAFQALPAAGWDALAQAEGWTFRPVSLQAKEGLALTNGTQIMTAVACLALVDAELVLRTAELAAAMSHEAARGVLGAYDPRVHRVRPQPHQGACAARIAACLEGSEIQAVHLNTAWLQRARIALDDAATHLDELCRALQTDGLAIPATVSAVGREAEALSEAVASFVPLDDAGRAQAQAVAAWAALTQRAQIAHFGRLLAPLRRHARALLETVQQPTFPARPETARVESALVAALGHLTRAVPDSPLVQDDYSLRCAPQVLGTAWRTFWHVHEVVEIEANSATDNPLLFPPEPPGGLGAHTPASYAAWLRADDSAREACREGVVGGGNFHGEPVAVASDCLAIAMAEVGSIAERRIAHLVDDHLSRGLPPFLVRASGLNSGFMIPQYTAAALVSENKVLAHPASVDSIPTSANTEDHVSMGTIAARKAAKVVGQVAQVVAIELLAARQGLTFRQPLVPGPRVQKALDIIRAAGVAPLGDDRVMHDDLATLAHLVLEGAFRPCFPPDPDLP